MEDSMDEAIETLQQDLERDMTARRSMREQNNFMQTQIDSLKHEKAWVIVAFMMLAIVWISREIWWAGACYG